MAAFTKRLVHRASDRHFEQVLGPLAKTCAISVNTPKTASLVFEKVYTYVSNTDSPPVELMTYPQGGQIVTFPAYSPGGPTPEERSVEIKFVETPSGIKTIAGPTRESLIYALGTSPDDLCGKIEATGYRPVLCYPRFKDGLKPFQAGDHAFVVACLTSLNVVDEQRLTWEQVLEVRRDRQSRFDLIRFLNWLNEDMAGKSQAFIQDRLALLYENQQRAFKKFGIYTAAAGEALLAVDPKSLGTLLAGGALSAHSGEPLYGMLSAGIAVTSSVVASVKKVNCTLQKERDAMAFFYGVKRATSGSISKGPRDSGWSQGSDTWDW